MRSWAVNLHAPFILSQLVLDDMVEAGSGSIVNISSAAAVGPGRGPYPDDGSALRGGTCYGAERRPSNASVKGWRKRSTRSGSRSLASRRRLSCRPRAPCFTISSPAWTTRVASARELMAQAALLLATEPLDAVTGRVTYSQQILLEYGLLKEGRGRGVDPNIPTTCYSQR